MLRVVSFLVPSRWLTGTNISVGGFEHTPWKNENGARLVFPSAEIVEIEGGVSTRYEGEQAVAQELGKLVGVEDKVWARVGDFDKVFGIANEDLERSTQEKTSSVHFMRFEFTDEMVAALKQGSDLAFGVDHEHCKKSVNPVPQATREALLADFN